MCACLVLRKAKWDSARECLTSLHWLPIRKHIKFKVCVLTYKLLHDQGPMYLCELLHYKSIDKRLRSPTDPLLLVIPQTKHKTFIDRSFSVLSPKTWNSLPHHIRQSENLFMFKWTLKTYLYHEAFYLATLEKI